MSKTPPALDRRSDYARRLQAASLAAAGMSRSEIRWQLGVSESQLNYWVKTDDWADMLDLVKQDLKRATAGIVAADKARRIAYAQIVIDKLISVVAQRAEAAAHQPRFPGDDTGLMTIKPTMFGDVAAVDTGLLKELREYLTYIAKETGEWSENVKVTGRVDHVHRRPNLKSLSEEELESLAALAERVYDTDMVGGGR